MPPSEQGGPSGYVDDSGPYISVVIPCRNGAQTLDAQLDALSSQKSAFAFEVIVADNGSTDATAEVVDARSATDSRIRRVDASRAPGINVARNLGVRAARGHVVVLCDADDVVHPGWIDAYGDAFAAGAACVGGGVDRVLANGEVLSRHRSLYTTAFSRQPYPLGANCGFRKDVFDDVGGFDEGFAGGSDEIEFFWRAALRGHSIREVPDAVISYRVRSKNIDVWRQYYRYGRGNTVLMKQFGGRWDLPRETALAPARILRSLILIAIGRAGTRRRRGGFENAGFQCGTLAEVLSRSGHRAKPLNLGRKEDWE